MNVNKLEGRYNYYAEQMTKFMTDTGMISEDESPDMEVFIRGCA